MKCEYCDNEIPQGVRRCPSCGAVMATGSYDVQPTVSPDSPVISSRDERKSRIAYILLGIFLGGLGIHNFYAGRLNRALGQLLTTVLAGWLIFPLVAVGIWVLVDICAITTDGEGRSFT